MACCFHHASRISGFRRDIAIAEAICGYPSALPAGAERPFQPLRVFLSPPNHFELLYFPAFIVRG